MLDPAGYVTEGSGQNLFVVKQGTVRTPPAWAGILKGVTRDAVIELARDAGLTVLEEPLNRYDIYTADEAFFTGTASEIAPVREVDGRTVGAGQMGPVTGDLRQRFRQLVRG
jgi:branched-chain amino acid aminotransferase